MIINFFDKENEGIYNGVNSGKKMIMKMPINRPP